MATRKMIFCSLAALLAIVCFVTDGEASMVKGSPGKRDRETMRALAPSNHNLTVSLYRELCKKEGNLFFSPLSIHSILTMTSLGAHGTTKKQFQEVLDLPDDHTITKGYRLLLKKLSAMNGPVVVKTANRIYTDKKFSLKAEFKNLTEQTFNAAAESVDFENDAVDVRDKINAFVEEQTNNRIKDLIAEDSLSGDTAMVLVNAVYFKGKWQTQFNPEDTVERNFHINKDKKVKLPMMQVKSDFHFQEDLELNAKILELNYIGESKLQMLLILPNKQEGLEDLEKQLMDGGKLVDLLNEQRRESEVNVMLPRFKLEEATNLNEALQEIGLQEMFGDAADFTNMIEDGPPLAVSSVAHKAFIETNEEGSEAAAATELNLVPRMSIIQETSDFIANHPFVFFIRHKPSRNVFFAGRFTKI